MTINEMVKEMHGIALSKGWWEKTPSIGESIALMHSELSEALEEARTNNTISDTYYECKSDKKNPMCCLGEYKEKHDYMICVCKATTPTECPLAKPCGIPSELADCVIRIMDFCGKHGIDLEKAIIEKANFNKHRPYKHGGKKF